MKKILLVIFFGLMGCTEDYGVDFEVSDLVKKCSNMTVYDLTTGKERPEFNQMAEDLCMLPIKHIKDLLDQDNTLFLEEYNQIVKMSVRESHARLFYNMLYPFDRVMTDKEIQKCVAGKWKPRQPLSSREFIRVLKREKCFVKKGVVEEHWARSLGSWLSKPDLISMNHEVFDRLATYKKENANQQ